MKTKHILHICILAIALFGGRLMAQVPADSLVAFWPLNGGGQDISGNNHNASTSFPSTNYPTPIADRFGVLGGASFFDGVDDHLEIPHHLDFNQMPLSFSFWMKADCYQGSATILDKYCCSMWNGWFISFGEWEGTPNEWAFSYMTSTCNGVFQSYSCNPLGFLPFPTNNGFDNVWHNYVFVVDYNGGKVYRDGLVIFEQPWAVSNPAAITSVTTDVPITIGGSGAYEGDRFHGSLDDIGIWQRALTAEEVTQIYGAQSDFCAQKARVFNDYDSDCLLNECFLGIENSLLVLNPGNITLQTDAFGEVTFCDLALADGAYEMAIVTANSSWNPSCDSIISFNIINGIPDTTLMFGLVNDSPCPSPDVSITCPTIRRCSEHTWPIYVYACNDNLGTGVLESAYVLVQLDENIIVDQLATPPYTMENGLYRFELGNINPGQCITLVINANFSCDLELGETLCMEATLYPVPECTEIEGPGPGECTEPWDHSSLEVEGDCDEDTGLITFTVENDGEAMVCESEVRVFVDGELFETHYIQLGAESDTTFTYPTNGGTWILQADQHPLHPGNSQPNDHVEGCGDIEGEGDGDDDDEDGDSDDDDEWEPGLVDDLPCGDESPFVDVYCGEVVGSYDPNDKQGFPNGVGETHDVMPNEQLQYMIRFQNTGTAPAYTVVIRDTLDTDLDIFSVTTGVASHPYTFTMYGQRVLQWTFNNIMLPDSFSNEEQSHGFITYTVNQMADLTDGTTITNSAAIYFDSNEPVITNTTLHTINHCVFTVINPAVTDLGNGILAAAPAGQSYQWVDCATGDAVAGATSNTLSGDDGLYAVQVTSANACTEESACLQLVGINELNAPAIRVFPVPASQTMTAMWTGDKTDYTITSPDGRMIATGRLSAGANTIDISALATGNYFLKADNRVTRFVVK